MIAPVCAAVQHVKTDRTDSLVDQVAVEYVGEVNADIVGTTTLRTSVLLSGQFGYLFYCDCVVHVRDCKIRLGTLA